jgi:hypothetical protein
VIVYADAAQLEALDHATTYCDGDQEGCSWDGAAHASQSRRRANSRAGGRVMDFEDDFGFRVQRWPGTGMGDVDNISDEHAILPGGEFQRARLESRVFVLGGTLIGDDPDDLKEKRDTLIRALSPFAYDRGAVRFRYTGAAVEKEIAARYAGGLKLDKVIWKYEQLALPFLANDPRWLALGENSEGMAVDTLTTRLILGKVSGEWSDLGPPDAAGTYTNIRDIKPGPDGKIYVCGDFVNFDNVAAADYIARYDPINDTWEAVGTPTALGASITSVRKMAFAPNGDLYVVGVFTNLGGTLVGADYVARFDGTAWHAVGDPANGATITDVRAISIGWGGRVWIGGSFSDLGGNMAADNIAYWDLALADVWYEAGAAGADGFVNDIWAEPFIDRVYATGNFDNIDGVAAAKIAVREVGAWAAMGTGLNNPGQRLLSAGGILYVVGEFTTAGPVTTPGAAYWNGEKWLVMGAGLDDPAYALAQLATGEVIVGGSFENIITVLGSTAVPAKGAAYWNGQIWSPPEFLLPGTPVVVYAAAALPNGDFYLGYDTEGDTKVPAITTINNAGSAPAWPLFRVMITGGAPSPLIAIENVTTDKRITFSYEMEPGRPVWIDLRPATMGMYHVPPKPGPGNGRFFRFAPGSQQSEFELAPGENLLNLYAEPKSGAVLSATVRWIDHWEGIDG